MEQQAGRNSFTPLRFGHRSTIELQCCRRVSVGNASANALAEDAPGVSELEPLTEVGEAICVAALCDPFGNRLGSIENSHSDSKTVR